MKIIKRLNNDNINSQFYKVIVGMCFALFLCFISVGCTIENYSYLRLDHFIIILKNFLPSINTVIKSLPDWLMLVIAYSGLKIWKKEANFTRKQVVIDEFQYLVQDCIQKVNTIIPFLEIVEYSIKEYKKFHEKDPSCAKTETAGLQEFVEQMGPFISKHLKEIYEEVPKDRLYIAYTKVSTIDFMCQNKINDCYQILKWFFDIINASIILLSKNSFNWNNPEVIEKMKRLETLDSIDFKDKVKQVTELSHDIWVKI